MFVVLTMCAPADKRKVADLPGEQKLIDHVTYVPFSTKTKYEGGRTICGVRHVPTRYIGHWQDILREVRAAGFEIEIVDFWRGTLRDINSSLNIAATRPV